jgi:adenylosuccinate synthase
MKLDVLEGLKTIKVCVGYRYKGKPVKEFPYEEEVLSSVQPQYEELPGWQGPTQHAREYKELPSQVRGYLNRLEDILGVKISMVSVGSSRDETIFRDSS